MWPRGGDVVTLAMRRDYIALPRVKRLGVDAMRIDVVERRERNGRKAGANGDELATSDGGTFACCIANGMTGAVRCVGSATKSDFA